MTHELDEAQISTLREMRCYSGPYHFRKATCKRLAGLGLAEPTRDDVVRPPYRITQAGRDALAALQQTPGA